MNGAIARHSEILSSLQLYGLEPTFSDLSARLPLFRIVKDFEIKIMQKLKKRSESMSWSIGVHIYFSDHKLCVELLNMQQLDPQLSADIAQLTDYSDSVSSPCKKSGIGCIPNRGANDLVVMTIPVSGSAHSISFSRARARSRQQSRANFVHVFG